VELTGVEPPSGQPHGPVHVSDRPDPTLPPAGEPAAEPEQGSRLPALILGSIFVLLLAALLVVFGLAMARRQAPGGGFGINAVGRAADLRPRPAPDFLVDSFGGGPVHLSEFRGRIVLLNFWASWCPPCREEARTLAAAAEAYTPRGVTFLGINVWDSDADARAFVERYDVRYPNGPDRDGRITVEYAVTGLPETFLITREGTLVRKWIGPLSQTQLDAFVEEALR
jgi:cytochrome c biogenesis protein CcmG/thiol:disulfide interchange protein DsbE